MSDCNRYRRLFLSCSAMATENEENCNNPATVAMEMVTFSAIVDDIIFPDGRASVACLGGGGE